MFLFKNLDYFLIMKYDFQGIIVAIKISEYWSIMLKFFINSIKDLFRFIQNMKENRYIFELARINF